MKIKNLLFSKLFIKHFIKIYKKMRMTVFLFIYFFKDNIDENNSNLSRESKKNDLNNYKEQESN